MVSNKNIEYLKYDTITSWRYIVNNLIKEQRLLKNKTNEVVVMKSDVALVHTLLQMINMDNVNNDKPSIYVLAFNSNTSCLLKIFYIESNQVLNEDDFSRDLEENNGIIRLIK